MPLESCLLQIISPFGFLLCAGRRVLGPSAVHRREYRRASPCIPVHRRATPCIAVPAVHRRASPYIAVARRCTADGPRTRLHMCLHPIKNRSTCHCAPRPFHAMAVHVVSASPSAAPCGIGLSFSVALVVHVLHVDDGLFACSGSIAVGTLRTEPRNVDRRTKRISVPVLTPCQRL